MPQSLDATRLQDCLRGLQAEAEFFSAARVQFEVLPFFQLPEAYQGFANLGNLAKVPQIVQSVCQQVFIGWCPSEPRSRWISNKIVGLSRSVTKNHNCRAELATWPWDGVCALLIRMKGCPPQRHPR